MNPRKKYVPSLTGSFPELHNKISLAENVKKKYVVKDVIDTENEDEDLQLLINFKDDNIEPLWVPYHDFYYGEKLMAGYEQQKSLTGDMENEKVKDQISFHSTWVNFRIHQTINHKGILKASEKVPIPDSDSKNVESSLRQKNNIHASSSGNHSSATPLKSAFRSPITPYISSIKNRDDSSKRKVREINLPPSSSKPRKSVSFSEIDERQSPPPWILGLPIPEENVEEQKISDFPPKPILKGFIKTPSFPAYKSKGKLLTKIQKEIATWKGTLMKSPNQVFISHVWIKPKKGYCEGATYFMKLLNSVDVLWLRGMIPLSYAQEILGLNKDSKPLSIFIMDSDNSFGDPENRLKRAYQKFECSDQASVDDPMTQLIGVLFLNEEKAECFLTFPNSEKTWRKFNFIKKPSAPIILVHCNIKVQKTSFFLRHDVNHSIPMRMITGDADSYFGVVIASANSWLDILPSVCASNPKFTVFGIQNHQEVIDLIQAAILYGGIHVASFDEKNIEIVFVHYCLIEQLAFMPNLTSLKRTPECHFYLFGWDPTLPKSLKLPEILVSGGYIAISTAVLLAHERATVKISNALNSKRNVDKSTWKVVFHPQTPRNLKAMGQRLQNWRPGAQALSIILGIQKGEFEILKPDEICEDKETEIKILYWTLLRLQRLYFQKARHFVLIGQPNELPIQNSEIFGGVEQYTFSEFEETYLLKWQ
ncbi:hypothetical protein G9A89_008980 [Geosiphon pyriformis]|nr:hypothetical protein G9A89_008980 [Geosiphon pyriformis]